MPHIIIVCIPLLYPSLPIDYNDFTISKPDNDFIISQFKHHQSLGR